MKHKKFEFHRSYWRWVNCEEPNEFKERLDALINYALNEKDDDILPEYIKMQIDLDHRHMGRFTSEYVSWRRAVFERDGYTCMICNKVGGKLNAHHIKPYAKYPNLRYDINNGITLCEKCHREVHRAKR